MGAQGRRHAVRHLAKHPGTVRDPGVEGRNEALVRRWCILRPALHCRAATHVVEWVTGTHPQPWCVLVLFLVLIYRGYACTYGSFSPPLRPCCSAVIRSHRPRRNAPPIEEAVLAPPSGKAYFLPLWQMKTMTPPNQYRAPMRPTSVPGMTSTTHHA